MFSFLIFISERYSFPRNKLKIKGLFYEFSFLEAKKKQKAFYLLRKVKPKSEEKIPLPPPFMSKGENCSITAIKWDLIDAESNEENPV